MTDFPERAKKIREIGPGILNTSLSLVLLNKLGLMGASISAVVSCIVSTILAMLISRRYIKVKIEIGTILYYIGISCLMFFVLSQINTGVVWMNLILKIITRMFVVGLGIVVRESEIRQHLKKIYLLRIR